MISPKDFSTLDLDLAITWEAAQRQKRIEDRIDAHLRVGKLEIDGGRSGWLLVDMDDVAARYRAAGWVVTRGVRGQPDFTFSLPVDSLQGYSPDEIVVGECGQTLSDVVDK